MAGAFQDIDLASAFAAVSRFSQTVLSTSNHGELVSRAMKNALVEQDVAHLVFPDDMQTNPSDKPASTPDGRMGLAVVKPADDDVADALNLLNSAECPILVVGHGAWDHMDAITKLAQDLGAPVLTTFKGKGLIADDHPNAAGVLGISGTPIASWFMNESDLILTLGTSFSNHTGIERGKTIIQVDYERMQLGKFHPVTLPIWSEIGAFCDAVAPQIKRPSDAPDQISELADRWDIWRREKQTRRAEETPKGIHSVAIFEALSRLAPADAIIAVDVGNNTYSFGRYFETKGQRVLMSGYLGLIGFGLPAAMGAWAATQDFDWVKGRKVISISCDGGFGQYAMELTTAVKYGMDITHVHLHNGELGKISKEQRSGEWPVWETNLHNPSFAAFAKICGAHGEKVVNSADIEAALQKALDVDGPALVEIMTDADLV